MSTVWTSHTHSHTHQLTPDIPRPSRSIPLSHAHWCSAAEDKQRCGFTAGFSSNLATAQTLFTGLSFLPFPSLKSHQSYSFLVLHLFGENWLMQQTAMSDAGSPLTPTPGFCELWWQAQAWVGCASHPHSPVGCPLDIHNLSPLIQFLHSELPLWFLDCG